MPVLVFMAALSIGLEVQEGTEERYLLILVYFTNFKNSKRGLSYIVKVLTGDPKLIIFKSSFNSFNLFHWKGVLHFKLNLVRKRLQIFPFSDLGPHLGRLAKEFFLQTMFYLFVVETLLSQESIYLYMYSDSTTNEFKML